MLSRSDLTQPLTYYGTSTLHPLGSLMYDSVTGKTYRYVRAAATVATSIAVGQALCADTGGINYFNNDMAGGTGLGTIPMGVAISTIPVNNYGWIQVGGEASLITTDGAVAAGDYLVCDTGADGGVDTMAAGEEHQVMGYVTSADVGTLVNCLLKGLI